VSAFYLKRALGRSEQRLPLTRYFLRVGGVLLALLLALEAYLPKLPVADRAEANLPVIPIHSDRKWPERVVFDTSLPTIVPAQVASSEPSTPPPVASAAAAARRAFAQMQPTETRQLQPNLKKPQRRSRIARRYAPPPPFAPPPQWQFGWFGQNPWRRG